jgi:hypothetical protein
MRRSGKAAIVIALAAVMPGTAQAGGGPGAVYNDYAQDGRLSCNHSRADLVGALHSGTLNQYGDPYTLAGLKLEVRRQLAGSCRHPQAGTGGATGVAPTGGGGNGGQVGQKPKARRDRQRGGPRGPTGVALPGRSTQASVGGSSGSFLAGRGLILLALVTAVVLGGWLTRHALKARD